MIKEINLYSNKKSNIFNHNYVIIVMFLLFLLPFARSFIYIDSVNLLINISVIISLILLVLYLALVYVNHKNSIEFIELIWIPTIFIPVLSNLNNFVYRTNVHTDSLTYTYKYVAVLILFIVSKYNFKWIKSSLSVIFIFCNIYVFCTLLFYLSPSLYLGKVIYIFPKSVYYELYKNYTNGSMAGLTTHYSTNGMYMSIAVAIGFSMLFNNKLSKLKKYSYFLITFIALILTGKRGHLLFTIMAMIITYYLYKSNKPRGRVIKILFYVSIAIIVFLLFSLVIPEMMNVINRFVTKIQVGDVTSGRIDIYKYAWNYFKSSPILGIGWSQFKYLTEGLDSQYLLDVHNVYLQLLCETGVVGFAIFTIPFVYTYFTTIRLFVLCRKRNIQIDNICYFIFSVFMQTFFLLYCFTGNPLYDIAMLYPYMYSCAIFNYFRYRQHRKLVGNLYEKRKGIS